VLMSALPLNPIEHVPQPLEELRPPLRVVRILRLSLGDPPKEVAELGIRKRLR